MHLALHPYSCSSRRADILRTETPAYYMFFRSLLTVLLSLCVLCAAQTKDTAGAPQQAEKLFRSVDQILAFASKDTGFAVLHPVQRRFTNRTEVEQYLRRSVSENRNSARLRRSEEVLKKFGLLPSAFQLETFLVALNREQVAGYYDDKTKYVNLLDWVEPDVQEPVLAHELTHALQDQSFDLQKWLVKDSDFDPTDVPTPTPTDIQNDERTTARQALAEGQAMVVLLDYMLAPSKQSLLGSPKLLDQLKQGMLVNSADSPLFNTAPAFLRQELTFPYTYGAAFVAEVAAERGKDRAFAGSMRDPPLNSRQIMEPQTYLAGEQLPPMPLPNFSEDLKDYDRFDIGAVGEFDSALLIEQYAGGDASKRLYPRWRGGYYYAAKVKNDRAAPLSLFYLSRWADTQSAAEFAAVYARGIPERYHRAHEVDSAIPPAKNNPEAARGSMSAASALEHPGPLAAPSPKPAFPVLSGTHSWLTETGPVVIEVHEAFVLITEGLDQPSGERLAREVFSKGN